MKTLKIVMALILLCLIVPTMAEDRRTDQTAYQANPGCQLKITLSTGETQFPINYRLTFHNAPTATTGGLEANGTAELLLPVSHQWYDLFVERDEVDKSLYTITTGCNTSASGTLAPVPVMTEDRWAAAQQMLLTFVQNSQGGSSIPTLSVGVPTSCTISTSGNIRMRAGHSTTAAVVGALPRNIQLQVIDRFAEAVGRQTRVWYRLVKDVVAPTSDAAEVWVGGAVKTSGDCVTVAAIPMTAGSGDGASSVGPQAGSWALTYGPTVYVTCNNAGSADFSTDAALSHLIFNVPIASTDSGFTLNGVNYSQDANSTWHGYYTESSTQAVGEALIRVDTPTRILGDLVITSNTLSDCTFKFPFWAAPQ